MIRLGKALVEDIETDPLQIGRVRARLVHHDGTKKDIPTDKLPYTTVLTPMVGVGSQGIAGSGMSPVGMRPGATIAVLWDTENPEYRIAVGTVPVDAGAQNGKSSSTTGALGGLASRTPGTTGPHAAKFETKTDAAKEIHSKSPPQYTKVGGKYQYTFSTKSDGDFRYILHDVKGQVFEAKVHPSGTFQEMQSDGSISEGVIGNMKISVDGEYTLGADKNMAMFTNNSMEMRIKDKLTISAKNIVITAKESIKTEAGTNIDTTAKQVHTIVGKTKVDINP